MTFADRLRDRRLLMANSRWDELVPREATFDFWNACGRPEIIWLLATHVTIWLWYRTIRRRVHSFLDAALRMGDTPALLPMLPSTVPWLCQSTAHLLEWD